MASHWMRGVIRAAAICAAAALGSVGLAGPGPARVEDDKKAAASRAREPLRGGNQAAAPVEPGRLLAGRRILIVESEPPAAGVIERALAAHGGTVLGPTASVAGALAWVVAAAPDAAVLGATGPGRWTAPPLAAALHTRGVPYVVITAGRAVPPRALREAPRLSKPFRPEELVRAVAAALARAA